MVPIDLSGKTAFVTGVADDVGFGWHIAKSLQAAGADLVLACHPRVKGIAERFLSGAKYTEARQLPFGVGGELAPKMVLSCDVGYDTLDDVPEDLRDKKGYRDLDVSIAGCLEAMGDVPIDILIHCVGFSPEVAVPHIDTSRAAYLTAMSVSSFSLVALTKALLPRMEGRDASVVGLSYVAGQRVVPHYGGGMGTAKAALECDAKYLAYFAGEHGHRVNIVSPGPYSSRAARSIGDIDKAVEHVAERAPLRRGITADEVASTVLYLCSPMASAVTGNCIFVDGGYHVMGV